MTDAAKNNAYDVVVIGAGPVGENVADRTRAAGLSTAVVESELVGGECSYWACMPSKALLRPVVARADARKVPGLGGAVQGPLDADAVLAYRDEEASHWKDEGQVSWLDGVGADVYRGKGRLTGIREVSVTGPDGRETRLTARHAVAVCTGSRAVVPALPGVADVRPWTSREATSAKEVPGRLVVVGGGVVGVEMATAWQGLGAQVTMLIRGERLLPKMEPFAGELVADALTEAGARVRTGVSAVSVRRAAPDGPVTVELDDGTGVEADEILFATGRAPRTDDLGLDTVGLEPGSWLDVDDSCRVTGSDWLYGVGDVNHRALLTHQGKYQARVAGAAIAARAQGTRCRGPSRGARTRPPPTTPPYRRSSSPTRRPPRSDSPWPRRRRRATGCGPSTTTWPPSRAPASSRRGTGDGPGWSWTWTGRSCAGSPSSGRASVSCCTPRRSRWRARSPSTGSGTRFRRTRRSARSGCGCWRRTGGEARRRCAGGRPRSRTQADTPGRLPRITFSGQAAVHGGRGPVNGGRGLSR